MEAQTFSPQPLDQDPADAKPEWVTTGKHHNLLIITERLQCLAEGDRVVTGHALCWRRVFKPLIQSWSHPFRCRNQIGLLHQSLKCDGEGAWGACIAAQEAYDRAVEGDQPAQNGGEAAVPPPAEAINLSPIQQYVEPREDQMKPPRIFTIVSVRRGLVVGDVSVSTCIT